jgi:predicted esterase
MHKTLFYLTLLFTSVSSYASETYITDISRDREIPISISLPTNNVKCSKQNKCPVAFINAGYGMGHNSYTFASDEFNKQGYLAIAVGHELKTDPMLNVHPPYMATRMENWHRGVVTLKFLVNKLAAKYTEYDFSKLTLFGHSNGGDISALYAAMYPDEVSDLITLDHRRMLLPRNKDIRVLTLRGSDYPADAGVLLSEKELSEFPVTQLHIEKSRHNDMYDGGPHWLVDRMSKEVAKFTN